jgi:hypothetical protein
VIGLYSKRHGLFYNKIDLCQASFDEEEIFTKYENFSVFNPCVFTMEEILSVFDCCYIVYHLIYPEKNEAFRICLNDSMDIKGFI